MSGKNIPQMAKRVSLLFMFNAIMGTLDNDIDWDTPLMQEVIRLTPMEWEQFSKCLKQDLLERSKRLGDSIAQDMKELDCGT